MCMSDVLNLIEIYCQLYIIFLLLPDQMCILCTVWFVCARAVEIFLLCLFDVRSICNFAIFFLFSFQNELQMKSKQT